MSGYTKGTQLADGLYCADKLSGVRPYSKGLCYMYLKNYEESVESFR